MEWEYFKSPRLGLRRELMRISKKLLRLYIPAKEHMHMKGWFIQPSHLNAWGKARSLGSKVLRKNAAANSEPTSL